MIIVITSILVLRAYFLEEIVLMFDRIGRHQVPSVEIESYNIGSKLGGMNEAFIFVRDLNQGTKFKVASISMLVLQTTAYYISTIRKLCSQNSTVVVATTRITKNGSNKLKGRLHSKSFSEVQF